MAIKIGVSYSYNFKCWLSLATWTACHYTIKELADVKRMGFQAQVTIDYLGSKAYQAERTPHFKTKKIASLFLNYFIINGLHKKGVFLDFFMLVSNWF